MGSLERAKRLSLMFPQTGWKRKVALRLLAGCGNCEERFACASAILNHGRPDVEVLKKAFAIMTCGCSYGNEPTPIARELALFASKNCVNCDGLYACISQTTFAVRGVPEDQEVIKRYTVRMNRILQQPDLPNRVQCVLDTVGTTEQDMKTAALVCFVRCNARHLIRRK